MRCPGSLHPRCCGTPPHDGRPVPRHIASPPPRRSGYGARHRSPHTGRERLSARWETADSFEYASLRRGPAGSNRVSTSTVSLPWWRLLYHRQRRHYCRSARLMCEEHSVEQREFVSKLCFVRPHVRMVLKKPAQGPLYQRDAIAGFDQRVTHIARGPIANASADDVGNDICYKAACWILPGDMGL